MDLYITSHFLFFTLVLININSGFQKLTNEPPPSYDALFGGTLPVSDSVHVSPRRPLTAAPLVVRGQSSMPQQAVSTDRETTWCLAEIYRSPLKTGNAIKLIMIILMIFTRKYIEENTFY